MKLLANNTSVMGKTTGRFFDFGYSEGKLNWKTNENGNFTGRILFYAITHNWTWQT